jgi:hypothetical protein
MNFAQLSKSWCNQNRHKVRSKRLRELTVAIRIQFDKHIVSLGLNELARDDLSNGVCFDEKDIRILNTRRIVLDFIAGAK